MGVNIHELRLHVQHIGNEYIIHVPVQQISYVTMCQFEREAWLGHYCVNTIVYDFLVALIGKDDLKSQL